MHLYIIICEKYVCVCVCVCVCVFQVALPVNLSRLIWNAQKLFHLDTRGHTDLDPVKIVKGLSQIMHSTTKN